MTEPDYRWIERPIVELEEYGPFPPPPFTAFDPVTGIWYTEGDASEVGSREAPAPSAVQRASIVLRTALASVAYFLSWPSRRLAAERTRKVLEAARAEEARQYEVGQAWLVKLSPLIDAHRARRRAKADAQFFARFGRMNDRIAVEQQKRATEADALPIRLVVPVTMPTYEELDFEHLPDGYVSEGARRALAKRKAAP